MKNFIVYEPATGEVLRSGLCQDEDFETQGTHVIEGVGNDETCCVFDGEVVEYSSEEVELKAQKPRYNAIWSNESMAWIDQRTLSSIKAAKWEQIKRNRAVAEYSTLVVGNESYDANVESQQLRDYALSVPTWQL